MNPLMNRLTISEEEFRKEVIEYCNITPLKKFDFVTGVGRSGAIASAYVSNQGGVPFLPHKANINYVGKNILIVDTVTCTGKTLQRASNWYTNKVGESGTVETFPFFYTPSKYYMWFEKEYDEKRSNELSSRR